MNNNRRKQIATIVEQLGDLEVLLGQLRDSIQEVEQDEQEYYDNMPEGLQGSDRRYASEEAISNLSDAASMLDDIQVSDIISSLENAAQ